MKKAIVICVAVLLLAGGIFAYTTVQKLKVTIPAYHPPGEVVWASQGWTEAQRVSFHHTVQGTRLVPYAWFKVLEQPCLSLSDCGLFRDQAYIGRFGFLPGKPDAVLNPDSLPIGFAIQQNFFDAINNQTYPVVGLNCAACHTGAMNYGKYTVEVDGAPAMIEVTQFQKALGVAVILTKLLPPRYSRFEKNILGPNASEEQKSELKKSFNTFLAGAKAEQDATEEQKIYANEAGFFRTDALARIGNQVFAVDMKNNNNFAKSNAPVRFPQIWNASWLDWVQYNSSIADPMVRNIGEALGVRAVAKLYGEDAGKFENSVNIEGLKTLEDLLAGQAPFEGLRSPEWPSVFPPLDQAKVTAGAALYVQHCQGCHLPPVKDLLSDLHSTKPVHWWKNKQGKSFLKVTDVPIDVIGTDPREAVDFKDRTADSGDLKKGRISAAVGLDLVTKGIRDSYFQKASFSPEKRIEWSGFRDPNDAAVRDPLVYKARPLNGIWAVAPYLHNGSVPNLYELLSPERSTENFWTGSRQFDPVKVGYETAKLEGGYLFDLKANGNSNAGHMFKDGPRGKGVIGPTLPEADRWAIIEYLKSIEEPKVAK